MMASPVAMPRLSGNQRRSVDTGDTYPKPRPHPPNTPYPAYTNGKQCVVMPTPPSRNPPPQQAADRRPTCNTHTQTH